MQKDLEILTKLAYRKIAMEFTFECFHVLFMQAQI